MPRIELYGTPSCPFTSELREWLELRGTEFEEYNVEADGAARDRIRAIAGEQRTVPLLFEDGKLVQVGWQGRGCAIGE